MFSIWKEAEENEDTGKKKGSHKFFELFLFESDKNVFLLSIIRNFILLLLTEEAEDDEKEVVVASQSLENLNNMDNLILLSIIIWRRDRGRWGGDSGSQPIYEEL